MKRSLSSIILLLLSQTAQAESYLQDSFILSPESQPSTYEYLDCNGSILQKWYEGLPGNLDDYKDTALRFVRNGNRTESSCGNQRDRVELHAKAIPPQSITPGETRNSRWFAFSFKVTNTSPLSTEYKTYDANGNLISSEYPGAIIFQQWFTSQMGPKTQFYLSEKNGQLSINFLHQIVCGTSPADEYILVDRDNDGNLEREYNTDNYKDALKNNDNEQLCKRNGNNYIDGSEVVAHLPDKSDTVLFIRKARFDSEEITTDTWYHVRLEVIADAPVDGREIALGKISAAIKAIDGSWKAFTYRYQGNPQAYFSTFTHEVDENNRMIPNQNKFGWYGKAAPETYGYIYFDEVHINDYFGALPLIYRN